MKTLILFILLFSTIVLSGQVYKDPDAAVEDRVNDVLGQMTLNEKLDYVGGYNSFYIRSIARLGLPLLKMSDGPVGVRNYGNTTAYPAGICLASTWDTSLVRQEGIALGNDARARGVHILLGPGLNIYRAPMCGRNFEYFGEDPWLAGQMAASYITGVQSRNVVCTAKHFALNNQEWDRNNVSSDIDERTLQEIYLPAFKAAVKEGKAGAVMNSYNLINGVHATQNKHLNIEILKNSWYFDGILMSDWGSTYNGLEAALGGLDLEMPSAAYMSRSNLTAYINNGSLSEEIINDKVSRILRIIFRSGFYDNSQTDSSIPLDNPESDSIALKVARAGIVLLQNTDGILPLLSDTIKTIALIGPNADQYVAGGGSSYTSPFESVTIFEGLQSLKNEELTINHLTGIPDAAGLSRESVFYTGIGSEERGLTGDYFNNRFLTDPLVTSRTDTVVDFHWWDLPDIEGIAGDNFSIRWTGVIRPDSTTDYVFVVAGDDGYRLWVNNKQVINNWTDQALTTKNAIVSLVKGEEYPIKLEYYENGGLAEISFGYRYNSVLYEEEKNAALDADAAIVCVGFNSRTEGEGFDRTFELPEGQDSLINTVAAVNPNTIVIINAGGNVDMTKWINNVKAILHAWYPGQEGGTAIAEIIFGITNPGGRLPVSFEKKWEDNPAYNSYYTTNKNLSYSEGVFLGYRHYRTSGVEPMFPFGFGLSYTSFSYSNLSISEDTTGGKLKYMVSLDVKNTGSMTGTEVVQLYVKDINCSVPRPERELKSFAKVSLTPEQTKTITMVLQLEAFSFYSTAENAIVIEKGDFQIIAGSSSEDTKLTADISLSNDYIFTGGVSEKLIREQIGFYPIPANDVLNFKGTSFQTDCLVEIYDMEGKLLDSFSLEGSNNSYNTAGLTNGLYICRIISDRSVLSGKFIISK